MNLKELKERALKLKDNASSKMLLIKNKAIKIKDDAFEKSNKFIVWTKEELDLIINKSKTTSFINKETNIERFFKHKSLVIFAEEWTNFYKKLLFIIPIIATKAYSQNISLKLAKTKIVWVNLVDYQVDMTKLPCIIVFEEEKFYKKIEWEENILKLVKSLNLDINELIEKA